MISVIHEYILYGAIIIHDIIIWVVALVIDETTFCEYELST